VNLREAIRNGQLYVEGLKDESIQKASIDLHLGGEFVISRVLGWPLDPYSEMDIKAAFKHAPVGNGFIILEPMRFVLAATERVSLNNGLVGQVAGKSSLARLGLIVESAGFIDPGFNGSITLELCNVSPNPILLTPGMAIAQICVSRLDTPADGVYDGKYQNSTGPVASMYWKNKRPE